MNYKHLNNIIGWVVFAISLVVYLLTMAPTASFWDCGEFISCANELEVPHPPGAPLFLLIGRVFAMFATSPETVAFMVNLSSVFAAAFTVLFTFWITTTFAKKMIAPKDNDPSLEHQIVIFGSGVVGALVCAFSDSFWFNAVEAEVYGMSSFFTAIVLWLMLKWEARADEAGNEKWIVLIAYVMGLSIGVHLLNLLTIPALGLIYYFRKYNFSWFGFFAATGISVVILAVIQFGIILYTFDIAWGVEQFMVGTIEGSRTSGLGLPSGTGLAFTLLALAAGLVALVGYSIKKGNVLLNTITMSVIVIYIGLGSYAMIPIRSNANPPIDENDPASVHSFLSYMKREQYGDFPIFTGQLYNAQPIDMLTVGKEYIQDPVKGKYVVVGNKVKYKYNPKDTKLFPRMWDRSRYNAGPHGYYNYVTNKGADATPRSPGDDQPSGADDIRFLINYQIIHMYWRYFMWNFAGRESDVQDCGWESGLNFGRNAKMPALVKNDHAKNHYFLLPFVLGILGLYWQSKKDKDNALVVGMLFFFTGFAIILYLNQPPMQPRERDYAFVGSFQTFAIWIGLGVAAIYGLLQNYVKGASAYIATFVGLVAPTIMLAQNYQDHSRAGNYVCPDSAYNLLNSLAPNAVLFTNGDNDTFPLWYAQEVEGVRPDVRVLCLSYVNTDWYINQMKMKMNQSEPLPITLKEADYTGTEKQVKFYKSETLQVNLTANPDQLLADKIINESEKPFVATQIPWLIKTRKEGGGNLLMLADMLIMNLVENVAKQGWKRPVYFANTVAPSSFVGLEPYLRQEGLAYRITPIKKNDQVGYYDSFAGSIQPDLMFENLTKKFKYRNLDNADVYYDENTRRMLGNYYNTFSRLAYYYVDRADRAGKDSLSTLTPEQATAYKAKAKELLDFTEKKFPYKIIVPDNYLLIKIGVLYDRLGEKAKAEEYFKTAIDWSKQTLAYYDGEGLYYAKADNELASMSVLMQYYQQTQQIEKLKALQTEFEPFAAKQRGGGYDME